MSGQHLIAHVRVVCASLRAFESEPPISAWQVRAEKINRERVHRSLPKRVLAKGDSFIRADVGLDHPQGDHGSQLAVGNNVATPINNELRTICRRLPTVTRLQRGNKMSKRRATRRTSTTAPSVGAATSTSNPCDVRECLITVALTRHRISTFRMFPRISVRRWAWSGALYSGDLGSGTSVPPSILFSSDDSVDGRDRIVKTLQRAALQDGFSHCEVRDYFRVTENSSLSEDPYRTLFIGPLRDQSLAA